MPNALTHPSQQELSDFGLGRLPAAAAATVASHLETCPACQKAVEGLPPDSFLGKVRSARPSQSAMPPSRSAGLAGAASLPGTAAAPPEGLPPELASYPKYRFVRELGRGGMGVVYQAEQTMMGRNVAVKVINPSVLAHPDALPRFHSEVRAAAKLDHPNIVRAYDAEPVGGLHLLVMEYVEGVNLADLVQRKGPLLVAHACHFIRQAALGLQHAFEQGMVHRDIKPQNLMVTPKGVVKVLDFGLARLRDGGRGLTEMGSFMGTPEYVSPEQATDARTADTRADLYSLGCTLYFLLTGRPPFLEDTAVKVILAQIEKQPPPVQEVRPEVPAELSAVVARLLAKDPAQRYQRPVEVAQALVPFIKQGPKREGVSSPPMALPVSDRGTVLGANTSKILKTRENPAGKPPAPPAALEDKAAAPFADSVGATAPLKKATKGHAVGKPTLAGWYQRWPRLAVVGGVVLLLGLVGLWASGALHLKTKDGTLVLEDLPADAEVLVDGGKATVKWGANGKSAEVSIAPGKRQVVVKREGFQVKGEEVVIEEGGRRKLTVRLEPLTKAAPAGPQGGPPSAEGRLPAAELAKAAPAGPQGGPDKPLPSRDGWQQLFDKKDVRASLPGQGGKPWFVVDGVLGNDTRGSIFTRKTYTNFNLSMEFQISADTAASIDIWSSPGDTPIWVFLENTRNAMGAITFENEDKRFNVHRLKPPAELRPDGEWNELTIKVRDCNLSVSLNGRALDTANIRAHVEGRRSDSPPAERLMGRIGLTKRWGNGKILIRNLSIKE